MLARVQLVLLDSCVLFLKAAFQPVILQPALVHGAITPQVQNLALLSVLLSLSSLPSFSTSLAFLVVVLVVVLL